MIELTFIRHFKTKGNLERRYIGTTDESLEKSEIPDTLGNYPEVDVVFVSPLKRCIETATLIYPEILQYIVNDFRECDFGMFENKNYEELKDLPEYQKWLDSMGKEPFPGGEAHEVFCARCVYAFKACLEKMKGKGHQKAAFVVHGGTIMAILEEFNKEKKTFYEFQVANGRGYHLYMEESQKFVEIEEL